MKGLKLQIFSITLFGFAVIAKLNGAPDSLPLYFISVIGILGTLAGIFI